MLSSHNPDECIVHFESISDANQTTLTSLEHDQGERENSRDMLSADDLQRISDQIESLSTDDQPVAGPEAIDKLGKENGELAGEVTRLLAENKQLKQQQVHLEEALKATQERSNRSEEELQKAHEDLRVSKEQCRIIGNKCNSLVKEVSQMQQRIHDQDAQIS